jgi:hypothetical protein
MENKTHEPIEGYTFYSNYSDKYTEIKQVVESMQKRNPELPIEAIHITEGKIYGKWSAYVRNDYAYVAKSLIEEIQNSLFGEF